MAKSKKKLEEVEPIEEVEDVQEEPVVEPKPEPKPLMKDEAEKVVELDGNVYAVRLGKVVKILPNRVKEVANKSRIEEVQKALGA